MTQDSCIPDAEGMIELLRRKVRRERIEDSPLKEILKIDFMKDRRVKLCNSKLKDRIRRLLRECDRILRELCAQQ